MDPISKAAEFIADLRFAIRQEPQIPETILVSTGVCTDIYLAEPGDEIVADFGTLGTAEVSFS